MMTDLSDSVAIKALPGLAAMAMPRLSMPPVVCRSTRLKSATGNNWKITSSGLKNKWKTQKKSHKLVNEVKFEIYGHLCNLPWFDLALFHQLLIFTSCIWAHQVLCVRSVLVQFQPFGAAEFCAAASATSATSKNEGHQNQTKYTSNESSEPPN